MTLYLLKIDINENQLKKEFFSNNPSINTSSLQDIDEIIANESSWIEQPGMSIKEIKKMGLTINFTIEDTINYLSSIGIKIDKNKAEKILKTIKDENCLIEHLKRLISELNDEV